MSKTKLSQFSDDLPSLKETEDLIHKVPGRPVRSGTHKGASRVSHDSFPSEQALINWISVQKTRPARFPAPRIGQTIHRLMKPFVRKFGAGLGDITDNWADIVGEKLARLSKPERLQRHKDGHVLVVKATGSAAFFLEASSSNILDHLNRIMGTHKVSRLSIQQISPEQLKTKT